MAEIRATIGMGEYGSFWKSLGEGHFSYPIEQGIERRVKKPFEWEEPYSKLIYTEFGGGKEKAWLHVYWIDSTMQEAKTFHSYWSLAKGASKRLEEDLALDYALGEIPEWVIEGLVFLGYVDAEKYQRALELLK